MTTSVREASVKEVSVVQSDTAANPANLLALARRIKAARSARANFLHPDLFAEPAWDMMLALYVAEGEGCRLKVSDLCNESGVPGTTALRWIDRLTELEIVHKRRHTLDGRATFVELDPDATRKMNAYLENVCDRFFPPA